MNNMQNAREEIDEINDYMLKLFIKRMEISKQIGLAKIAEGKPIYDRKREEEIIQKVSENTPPDLCGYAIELFKKMMELSRDYQNEK